MSALGSRSIMTNLSGLPARAYSILLFVLLVGAAGCGRSGLNPQCVVSFAPAELDFGSVRNGSAASRDVTIESRGDQACLISAVELSPDSDPAFSVRNDPAATLTVWPGQRTTITVSFAPKSLTAPLTKSGKLRFVTDDSDHPSVEIPLAAQVESRCTIAVSPAAVDFGHVALGSAASRAVNVRNVGLDPCQVSSIALDSGSDSEFSLSPTQPQAYDLAPGSSSQISVTFTASDDKKPHHRSGTLTLHSSDPAQAAVSVPLSADIDIGCDLTISPSSLDFGNVMLNTTAKGSVLLGNDGSATCQVSGIALGAGTDPHFALAAGQATSFQVPPGSSRAIALTFAATDSAPPHLKTGTLDFQTGDRRAPNATVPLSAYVNTICVEASRWIYTVEQNGMFARFDPATLTFTDIGKLACPSSSSPNSMAVDQNAVAWVAYMDGHLFRVDTQTAQCEATAFQVGQHGLIDFGMGFVFDPMTGVDTLYIAGGGNTGGTMSTLATISFPALTVTPIGTVAGFPEMSGTGDGQLWGFSPSSSSVTGQASLYQIDPSSGATIKSYPYPGLTGIASWAMKFWGGSFWIFLGQSVYQVQRATPAMYTTAIANSGRTVVGAGVSTCAPVQSP
jgi:hypothetical protein